MSSSAKRIIADEKPLLEEVKFGSSVGGADQPQGLESKDGSFQSNAHSGPLDDENAGNRSEDIGDDQHGRGRSVVDNYKMEVVPGIGGHDLETRVEQLYLLPPLAEFPITGTESLEAEAERVGSGSVPPTHPAEQVYLDPTPRTPGPSAPTSRPSSQTASRLDDGPISADYGLLPRNSLRPTSLARNDATLLRSLELRDDRESQSEIQSIMDQFDDEGGGPGAEEVMSPRLDLAGPSFPNSVQHPPRMSSLEPLRSRSPIAPPPAEAAKADAQSPYATALPQLQVGTSSGQGTSEAPSVRVPSLPNTAHPETQTAPASPDASLTRHRSHLPEPDPEPDLPFDFHRFLEQLRHRTADPVAKFLRSFLVEFGKKQWMVHEQVKIVSDFLAFITNKMAQCEVWRGVSDAEFDNAKEGMEKLVMNRLYSQTFSPAIPPCASVSENKAKGKRAENFPGLGRRGQHQEDIERDEILAQKVSIYGWIQEEHLDIAAVGDSGRRFLSLAQKGT